MTETIVRNVTRMTAVATWFRQHLCRHEYLRVTEGNRVFLKCEYCQRETPGWDLSGITAPSQVFSGDPERFKLPRVGGALVKPQRKPRRTKFAKVNTTKVPE